MTQVADYIKGVLEKDLRSISRAITLVESTRPEDRGAAEELLAGLLPHAGRACRVGISGAPGAGKSTLIETLGLRLVGQGRRLAVLAVDPSSVLRGGSILGDKTRMGRLCESPLALVRPSPSGNSLGGVASRTRETIAICEAAGHELVIVESVGVGQAEHAVAGMVDCFLLLVSPDGGDELQSIKRGTLELADAVAVTKADGETAQAAARLRQAYDSALELIRPAFEQWRPPVLAVSARTGEGIGELWAGIEAHHALLARTGELDRRRAAQATEWMWRLVEQGLRDCCRAHPAVPALEQQVAQGILSPLAAARRVLESLLGGDK